MSAGFKRDFQAILLFILKSDSHPSPLINKTNWRLEAYPELFFQDNPNVIFHLKLKTEIGGDIYSHRFRRKEDAPEVDKMWRAAFVKIENN